MTIKSRLVSPDSKGIPSWLFQSSSFSKLFVAELRGMSDGHVQSARTECLKETFRTLRKKRPGLSIVFLLIDAAWKVDDRLARYYGFWKQFEREGYVLPTSLRLSGRKVRADHKIKFWGVAELRLDDVAEANRALLSRDGCFLLVETLDKEEVARLIEDQPDKGRNPAQAWEVCKKYIAEREGFCIYPFGGFDDREICVYIAGLGESLIDSGIEFERPAGSH
jgi:hypothetical protein